MTDPSASLDLDSGKPFPHRQSAASRLSTFVMTLALSLTQAAYRYKDSSLYDITDVLCIGKFDGNELRMHAGFRTCSRAISESQI